MRKKTKRRFDSAFKAKVAVAAARPSWPRTRVHPVQIYKWNRPLPDRVSGASRSRCQRLHNMATHSPRGWHFPRGRDGGAVALSQGPHSSDASPH